MYNPPYMRPPLSEPLDALLADIAIRIQLSATNYQLAVDRYNAVQEWIERDTSPLAGRMATVYPQGSMAIGATIASKVETDEFDIDLIAMLDISSDTSPHEVLNTLELAIRGEPGSRYYNMAERCTRCIQIHYAGGMHLDVTPMVRIPSLPERCGYIYHARERRAMPDDRRIIANPWAFAQWFLEQTPEDRPFREAFAERARAYESLRFVEAADVEPVPEQSPAYAKPMAVIALQLLKRYRNLRYDGRAGRRPPSVFLAKSVADNAGHSSSLSDELDFQARQLRDTLSVAQHEGRVIDVRNPRCKSDCFTDRWPATLEAQGIFVRDLSSLLDELNTIRGDCSLSRIQATLAKLFGEVVTFDVVKQFNARHGRAIVEGRSRHVPGAGRVVLPASVAASVSCSTAAATPKHTFFGAPQPE